MPTWVKVAVDAWAFPASVTQGHVFRPVNRADRITGERLGEKVVWQLIKPYADEAGVPGIAPRDLRRTCAKLCRAGGGELEQIQSLLGSRFRANHRAKSILGRSRIWFTRRMTGDQTGEGGHVAFHPR